MIHAKYTVVLKTLLDNEEVKPEIEKALSSYPIYQAQNESVYAQIPTREELNKKILNYYKYREIGFETVGRFIDELEITMNEIMPYYNQLYKSIDVMNGIDDIFGNVDMKESFEQETKGNSKGDSKSLTKASSETDGSSENTSEVQGNTKNVHSDTPQSSLNTFGTKEIHDVDYASDIAWNENISTSDGKTEDHAKSESETESTGESNQETSGTTKHTLTRKGNQGINTYAHDMLEFRNLFLNIEQQIIHDKRLSELFMLIY